MLNFRRTSVGLLWCALLIARSHAEQHTDKPASSTLIRGSEALRISDSAVPEGTYLGTVTNGDAAPASTHRNVEFRKGTPSGMIVSKDRFVGIAPDLNGWFSRNNLAVYFGPLRSTPVLELTFYLFCRTS